MVGRLGGLMCNSFRWKAPQGFSIACPIISEIIPPARLQFLKRLNVQTEASK